MRMTAEGGADERVRKPMSKQGWMTLALGVAIAVNGILLGLLVGSGPDQVAEGQSANGTNGFLMTTGVLQGKGASEAMYLFDTNDKKLAIYFMNNTRLELIAVRDLTYDFIPQSYSPKSGRQEPSVKDMKEGTRGG